MVWGACWRRAGERLVTRVENGLSQFVMDLDSQFMTLVVHSMMLAIRVH